MQERKLGGGRKRGVNKTRREVRGVVTDEIDTRLSTYKTDSERTNNWIVKTAIDEFLKSRNY